MERRPRTRITDLVPLPPQVQPFELFYLTLGGSGQTGHQRQWGALMGEPPEDHAPNRPQLLFDPEHTGGVLVHYGRCYDSRLWLYDIFARFSSDGILRAMNQAVENGFRGTPPHVL